MSSQPHATAFENLDEEALGRLVALLALDVRAGDVVLLRGDLGAGKTTFARALIRALLGRDDEEIPSPTFSLLQSYESPRVTVHHFDFYRLGDLAEALEIGLEEALATGLVLIEWPERVAGLGEVVGHNRLELTLAAGRGPMERTVRLVGHGGWRARLERLEALMAFLRRAGWHQAQARYLQGDASPRRYARLHSPRGQTAILMDAPAAPDGPPIRDGKSYSAIAHLAEDVRPFVAVAGALRDCGLSAPEVLGCDLENGLLLLEDFGSCAFADQLHKAADPLSVYRPAIGVLLRLLECPPPPVLSLTGVGQGPKQVEDAGASAAQGASAAEEAETRAAYRLPDYDLDAYLIEVALLLDWYFPAATGRAPSAEVRGAYLSLWRRVLAPLEGARDWVLRDYHSPNLMWLPGREGARRIGLLDFQDAVRGHAAYDLVSLLQDARIDVSPAREAALFEEYCRGAAARRKPFERAAFAEAYAVLGAQRASKVLGIFTRLAARDAKPQYLAHLSRVWGYLERNLAHPRLAELKAWFEAHLPPESRAIGALEARLAVREPRGGGLEAERERRGTTKDTAADASESEAGT